MATKEKRSADEMREVVERLSAGCSARPREKTRRRGANSAYSNNALAGVALVALSNEQGITNEYDEEQTPLINDQFDIVSCSIMFCLHPKCGLLS